MLLVPPVVVVTVVLPNGVMVVFSEPPEKEMTGVAVRLLSDAGAVIVIKVPLRLAVNPASPILATILLAVALSLMVFYVLAMQCMSTLAVVKRGTKSWKWPTIQLIYMTVLAYGMSWITYILFS